MAVDIIGSGGEVAPASLRFCFASRYKSVGLMVVKTSRISKAASPTLRLLTRTSIVSREWPSTEGKKSLSVKVFGTPLTVLWMVFECLDKVFCLQIRHIIAAVMI